MAYTVFKRSATSFEELAKARKTVICTANTEAEARSICHDFNENRTPTQRKRGTRYEYTRSVN